jgi:hypothetical protein
MPDRLPLAVLLRIPPFASDRPIPHVLIISLALVAAAFAVVYWSIAGFA